MGNGVDVGKGVVFGGAVGVKVGVGTGVGVAVGSLIGVGVGTGLTNRSQPNRNPPTTKTVKFKFRTIAGIPFFAGNFPFDSTNVLHC
jgi:hypothetical protein